MQKLSTMGYRLGVAATLAGGLAAALFGIISAVTDSEVMLAIAVAVLGLALASGALTLHFHLRELLRVLMPALRPATTELDPEVREALLKLSQDATLRRNNELHLLDAVRRLDPRRDS